MLNFIFSLLIIFSSDAFAQSRNCATKNTPPLCPNTGATILDETYPTQTFVVSMAGKETNNDPVKFKKDAYLEVGEKLPADFITKILESYTLEDNRPEIIVPGNPVQFKQLIKRIETNLLQAKMPPEFIQKQIRMIKNVDTKSYTWQQDYFESFISPETGRPVLREVASYDIGRLSVEDKRVAIKGLKSTSDTCPVEIGPPLADFLGVKGDDPKSTSWMGGEMGGNIEGLPGGLCLSGNNQAADFISQYCGPTEKGNSVEVDVGWMAVGHVDEVIKVVPIEPKIDPAECNFTIWMASPDMGLEVLKNKETINNNFLDFPGLNKKERTAKLKDIVQASSGTVLCRLVQGEAYSQDLDPIPASPKANSASIWDVLKNLLILNAQADNPQCLALLESITNKKMVELMEKDTTFVELNQLVQEKMDANQKVIETKLQERLPQCKNISFAKIPDLFYGSMAKVKGKHVLAEPGFVGSLFPNPTNSVLANQTLIVPEAPNAAINNSVSKIALKQGIKTKFVDTWNYAHRGDGNMHCSSHSLTYCQPRVSK